MNQDITNSISSFAGAPYSAVEASSSENESLKLLIDGILIDGPQEELSENSLVERELTVEWDPDMLEEFEQGERKPLEDFEILETQDLLTCDSSSERQGKGTKEEKEQNESPTSERPSFERISLLIKACLLS